MANRCRKRLKAKAAKRALKAAEQRDTLELASRLRQYTTGVMRYAVQHGYIETNPASDLVGATATRKAQHRPALPLERLPELLQRIEARPHAYVAQEMIEETSRPSKFGLSSCMLPPDAHSPRGSQVITLYPPPPL